MGGQVGGSSPWEEGGGILQTDAEQLFHFVPIPAKAKKLGLLSIYKFSLYVRKEQHMFPQKILQYVQVGFIKNSRARIFWVHRTTLHVQVQYTDFFSFFTLGRCERNFSDPHDYFELYVSVDMKVVITFLKYRADFFYVEKKYFRLRFFLKEKTASFPPQFIFPF
jgi:hypothetical protein